MRAIIGDTETASLEGGVCDIALLCIDENLKELWRMESLIDPERPISPSASGIHHITDDMVWTAPTLSEFMDMKGHPLQCDDLVIIGHNISFDCRVLGSHMPEVYRKLCTLRIAKNLFPDNENHQLQTLRYQFKLEAGDAHRAMGDVITCWSFLKMLAEDHDCDLHGLIELARKPLSLDSRIPFGKHKGDKLRDLPTSYVRWLLDKADSVDEDLREALEGRLSHH